MKLKIIFCYLIMILCISQILNTNSVPVFSLSDSFYRINSSDAYFYKEANTNSKMFKLEKTYFVKQINAAENGFLYAEYNGIFGYVITTDLLKINGTPLNPYLSASFDMNGSANAVLFSEPNNQSKFLGTVPFNATSITYFGKIEGQEMLTSMGTDWYYCKYTSFEQGVIFGYIYAPLTKNLSNIQQNNESFPDDDFSETNANPIEKIIAPEIRDSNNLFIILSLLIFTSLILFLGLKNIKRRTKKVKEKKQYIDNLQKNYLEFNEKDDF